MEKPKLRSKPKLLHNTTALQDDDLKVLDYSENNEHNNYNFDQSMFPTYTVHNISSYNNTDVLMNDKIIYYNLTNVAEILRTKIDYPQWVLKQAVYKKHDFWTHMFPQEPAQISQKQKEMCQNTPLLVNTKTSNTRKKEPKKPKWITPDKMHHVT